MSFESVAAARASGSILVQNSVIYDGWSYIYDPWFDTGIHFEVSRRWVTLYAAELTILRAAFTPNQ